MVAVDHLPPVPPADPRQSEVRDWLGVLEDLRGRLHPGKRAVEGRDQCDPGVNRRRARLAGHGPQHGGAGHLPDRRKGGEARGALSF